MSAWLTIEERGIGPLSGSKRAAFWLRTDVSRLDGCWLWTGAIDQGRNGGYGVVWVNGRHVKAHRLAYELEREAIPEGLVVDHLCRVRRCINPAHMEVVTHRTNILRGQGIAARKARKTHCKRGHPFTPANTYIKPTGRECRTCAREYKRLWELKRKGNT